MDFPEAYDVNNIFQKAIDLLSSHQGMCRAWHKAKAFGFFKWPAFLWFAIVPLIKLLCGKGDDYIERFKKRGCVLKLVGPDVERNTFFHLPNFATDLIQGVILRTDNFYERLELAHLKANYVPIDGVCLDIGANIGNHSIFFAKNCHVSKVFAFEPVPSTFAILKRNIELNNLEGCIRAYDYGISNCAKSASIDYFDESNIGGTSLAEDVGGPLKLFALDDIPFPNVKIDFVKIDVEGMEYEVLCGGAQFFAKNKPVVYIEIFPDRFDKVDSLMNTYGYSLVESLARHNFIYCST